MKIKRFIHTLRLKKSYTSYKTKGMGILGIAKSEYLIAFV